MKQLIKLVLGLLVDENDEDIFSDWNTKKLPPKQIKYALLDVDGPLRMYEELLKTPDLTIRLNMNDVKPGKKVDLVPRYGNVACMATRAATGCIIDADICQSPDGILQKKVRAGSGMVAIQLENVYSPRLEIPHYQKEGSRSQPTLADFGTGQVVGPVQMLKEHVASNSIRVTPTDENTARNDQAAGITLPMSGQPLNVSEVEGAESTLPAHSEADEGASLLAGIEFPNLSEPESTLPVQSEADEGVSLLAGLEFPNLAAAAEVNATESTGIYDNYPSDEQIDDIMIDLTSNDIELLRASILEGGEAMTGRMPLNCAWLPDPPSPDEIFDVFSPVLGDVFHAMQRPYVPVKHEAKKGYYVALQNAFYVWNEEKMAELEHRMEAAGLTKHEIESMKY